MQSKQWGNVSRSMRKSNHNRKRGQLNNSGMSLVEVMIAIMILAVVAGPVLKIFVTTMQYNARAREQQSLNTAAQSVMEGFKAYDMEELCEQFNGITAFQVVANATGGVMELNPGDGDENYTFRLEDLSYEGKVFYDAEVTVTPRIPGVPDADVTYNGIKTNVLVSAEQMNSYLDAVYKQDVAQDVVVYSEILEAVLLKLNEKDEMYEYEMIHLDKDKISVKKVTTVGIYGSDSTGHTVNVQTEYKYSVTDYPYYDAIGNPQVFSLAEVSIVRPSMVIYDSATATAADGAVLENVYLYYYPAYNSGLAEVKIAEETIAIYNFADTTKNVYLFKQKFPEARISNTSLITCESSYQPTVIAGDKVQLYHNLNENLASKGSPVGTVSISTTLPANTEYVKTEEQVMVYNITVALYDADAGYTGTPLLTLEGTKN